ncbi:MAG: LysE family translocator [Micromonosporaceae bacterium]
MDVQLVAFVAASLVLIVVPGVDFALVTRQTVGYGRRAAFITLTGLVTGGLVHAGLAIAGLSVLLLTSAQLYAVVRLAGAAYLVYIGVQTLVGVFKAMRTRAARTASPVPTQAPAPDRAGEAAVEPEDAPVDSGPRTQSARSAYVLGVVSNLLNVKVVVFYVTFLPQFVTPGPGAPIRTAMLAVTFIGLAVAWWICYILLLDRIGRWMSRPAVKRGIEGVTGAVLVGLGAKIALDA